MRLAGDKPEGWAGTGEFYVAAAEAMRRILIEHARARARVKRGGGREPRTLQIESVAELADRGQTEEIMALDEAIRRVSEQDERLGNLVRLRIYAGLGVEQTAEALGVSPRTVKRDWAFCRAWLYDEVKCRLGQ